MVLDGTNKSDKDRQRLFEELLDSILKRRMQPEDKYEIAAYLESIGWNDDRAARVFGAEDIFDLAESFWNSINNDISASTISKKAENISFIYYIIDSIKQFLRGLIFALPMAISVAAMITLRFSLWSYENLTLEVATSIAIGTILSFLVVGGFTQAIARRGFFYLTQGYYNMGRRMTFIFVRMGYTVCLIISVLLFLSNLFIEIFPFRMIWIIIAYFFFLSSIWLSVTVMYILKKELVFTGLIAFGILVVFVLVQMFGIYYIIFIQLFSLLLVSVIGIGLVLYYFKTAERKMEKGIAPSLPRKSITLYSVMPYFTYGFLYFSFLYLDRVIAWSTNNSGYMPYFIWFRGQYELGLDFALFMLMIPMGINEVVVNKLMHQIEDAQKNYLGRDTASMNNKFLSIYYRSLVIVTIISIISAFAVYFIMRYVDINYRDILRMSVFTNKNTLFVFTCSIAAYSLIAVALMNSILLFSLSQPEMVNKAIFKSLIVNVTVGFLSSRWMGWWIDNHSSEGFVVAGYSYAVLGLLAGGIVFMVLTSICVLKVFNNLDYYIYAAS